MHSASISDPEVINVVYGGRADFTTARYSKKCTTDETRHGAMRHSVAGAFTPNAVLDSEKWIDAPIKELLDVTSKKTYFNLSSMILWYAMDADVYHF